MVSLAVVVLDVLAHEETQVPLAEGDDTTETLLFKLAGVTPRDYRWLRVSPDGQRVVIDETTGNLWLYDLETQVEQEITFSGDDRWPIWSPDGREIIFTSTRDGPANLYRLAANLSGEVTRLTDSPAFHAAYDWFDDGNSLLIVTFEAVRSLVVVDVARGSDAEVVPLITSEAFRDTEAGWRTHWMARFTFDRSPM